LSDETARKACCDTKVKSTAGRDYCFNDIVHPAGRFDSCRSVGADPVKVFTCCDNLGGDDLYLAYDCKVERIGLAAVDKHIKALKATLYPDCAIIANDIQRKTCCDDKI